MKRTNTSERLKLLMDERNLKQVDILNMVAPFCDAHNVKMNRSDISQYVSGKVEPSQEKLSVLSMALGVSEPWLMGYDVTRDGKSVIVEYLGSDSAAAKKLQEIKRQFKSPMIDEMVNAMQRMTLNEQKKMIDVGKALFPERFKDDTKE